MSSKNWLFTKLQTKYADFPIENYVKLSVSSYQTTNPVCQSVQWGDPLSVIKLNPTLAWHTKENVLETWLKLDISKIMNLNWYTIAGYRLSVFNTCNYPIEWEFKGRNNENEEWNEIAYVKNAKNLVSNGDLVTFKTRKTRFAQYLVNVTKTKDGTLRSTIKSFDFLYSVSYITANFKKRNHVEALFVIFLIVC